MNPPIPEPIVIPHAVERGPRPEAMKYFMAISLFFTAAGILYCDGSMLGHSVAAELAIYLISTIIWLTLLRLVWKGHNWARLIAMIWCVLNVTNIFMFGEFSLLQQIVTITDAIFSLVFLWWLRTPAVVAFTKGKPASISN